MQLEEAGQCADVRYKRRSSISISLPHHIKRHTDAIAMNCDQLTAVSAKLETPNEEFVDIVDMYHMAIRQAAQSPYEVRRVSGYFRFAAFFLMNGWPKDFGHVRDSSNVNRPKVTQAIIDGDVEQAGMAMGQYILSGAFPG